MAGAYKKVHGKNPYGFWHGGFSQAKAYRPVRCSIRVSMLNVAIVFATAKKNEIQCDTYSCQNKIKKELKISTHRYMPPFSLKTFDIINNGHAQEWT